MSSMHDQRPLWRPAGCNVHHILFLTTLVSLTAISILGDWQCGKKGRPLTGNRQRRWLDKGNSRRLGRYVFVITWDYFGLLGYNCFVSSGTYTRNWNIITILQSKAFLSSWHFWMEKLHGSFVRTVLPLIKKKTFFNPLLIKKILANKQPLVDKKKPLLINNPLLITFLFWKFWKRKKRESV